CLVDGSLSRLRHFPDRRGAQCSRRRPERHSEPPPEEPLMSQALLSVVDLSIGIGTRKGPHLVVDKVNFEVGVGEAVAIVGESGSGKSVTALSVLGLRTSPSIGII